MKYIHPFFYMKRKFEHYLSQLKLKSILNWYREVVQFYHNWTSAFFIGMCDNSFNKRKRDY